MGAQNLDFLPRLGDGFKNMGKSIAGWFKSTGNAISEKLGSSSETFTVAEKNGKKVCQIPGQVNNLHGADLAHELEQIGETVEIRPLLNEGRTGFASGSKLRKFEFTHNGIDITVVDGKPKKMVQAGKDVLAQYTNPVQTADVAIKQEIEGILTKVKNGADLESLGLRNMYYQNVENGVKRFYSLENLGVNPELRCVYTRDFAIDSKAVKAKRNIKEIDEFLTNWVEGKLDISKLTSGKLKTDIGTFVVKGNGEIVELITEGGQHLKPGSVDFDALKYANKEIFENVPKQHASYTDRVYAMAA